MRKEIRSYCYSLETRKLCLVALLLVISITLLNAMTAHIERDTYIPGEGRDSVFAGKVSSFQIKEGYNSEYLSVNIKNVRYYAEDYDIEGDKDEAGSTVTHIGQSVQVYLPADSEIKPGQRIVVSGRAENFRKATNQGQFDSYRYYRNRGCLFAVKNATLIGTGEKYDVVAFKMYELKMVCEKLLDDMYGSQDGAILKAMLLGIKGEIDEGIQESFQKSGAAHILAISGLHISFLCMTIAKLLGRLGIDVKIRAAASIILLILYIIMVGFTPSAIRASLMFILYAIAAVFKRSYDMMTALGFAAIIILITNPGYLTDIGFLLSFMAILAVGLFAVMFIKNNRYINILRKMRTYDTLSGICHNLFVKYVLDAFIISGFVFLATAPILLYSYYELPIYSVLLNLLIIPLMSILLMSTVLSLLLTVPVYAASVPFILISKTILYFYKVSCGMLELSGLGRRNLGCPSVTAIVIYYTCLLVICLCKGRLAVVIRSISLLVAIAAMCIHPAKAATINMLDVGQGDGLVYIGENENTYIFDCGSTSDDNIGKNVLIPFLKYNAVSEVEAVFLSHPDKDHINGVEQLLERPVKECIEVKKIYVYEGFLRNGDYKRLCELAEQRNAEVIGISKGDILRDGKLSIRCLYPEKGKECSYANNMSLVLKVEYEDFSMLETGDIEAEGEEILFREDVDSDCLKVAHHGSASSSIRPLLEKVSPGLAIISAGKNNSYGHPNEKTLENLREVNCKTLCTIDAGQITVRLEKGRADVYIYNNEETKK